MKKLKVFTDLHHQSLYNSLRLLFEVRLGGELFRPTGMQWAEKGYWAVYPHLATQLQFLSLDQRYKPIDGTPQLNQIVKSEPDHYEIFDSASQVNQKAVTFEQFERMEFDLVIATIPQHLKCYGKLAKMKNAKFCYQIGNAWPVEANTVSNVMASAIIPNVPPGINFISYHQEFDIKEIFYPAIDPICPHIISSFINCFPTDQLFRHDWDLFQVIEKLMPDWEFKCRGGQGREGPANGERAVADAMRASGFIWHTKNGGDGYGHIIHNTGAVARPIIVKKEYYRGKMGEKLMVDGETCIAVDNLDSQQIVNKIRYYSEGTRFGIMCNHVYANFKKVVNFDNEEIELRKFIENLI